jgi:hypothetical protein
MKICSQCRFEGENNLFPRGNRCITCHKAYHSAYKKDWRNKNKDKIFTYNKQYVKDHPEQTKAIQKRSRNKNKEKYKPYKKTYNKKYIEEHKEDLAISNKIWRENNKEHLKIEKKKDYERNKEHYQQLAIINYENNKEEINKKKYQRKKKRLKNDPAFRCMQNASRHANLMLHSQGGSKMGNSFSKRLGYSSIEFKKHIENQFTPEMSWDNYGTYWHLDHIIPHSHTPYDSMEHPNFLKAWALSNLRPLEAHQNMSEGNRR